MQTIFIMVKCELGKSYEVADAAVQNDRAGLGGLFDLRPVRPDDEVLSARRPGHRPFRDGRADAARREGHLHADHLQGVFVDSGADPRSARRVHSITDSAASRLGIRATRPPARSAARPGFRSGRPVRRQRRP